MTVKVGLIGAGGIARQHLKNIDTLSAARLVAVHDIDPRRAQDAATPRQARVYDSAEALIQDSEAEAILICVPPFAHGDLEEKLARAGKHIFVEKPVGLDLDQIRRSADSIQSSGIVSSVAYRWRHRSGIDEARRKLQERSIALVTGSWIGGCPGVPWWREKARSGGQHVEQTTHIFDLARFLVGEVSRLNAFKSTTRILADTMENYDVEEATSAQLLFESGAVGHIASANVARAGDTGLTVYAENLTVKCQAHISIIEGDTETIYRGGNDLRAELAEFFEAIRKGDPGAVKSSYQDGMKSLELSLAIDRSIVEGVAVDIE